jgi:hypothetical protein
MATKIKKASPGFRIPYEYIVGQTGGKALPFDVKLSIDQNFNKAVTKWVTITSLGIAGGIVIGFLASKKRR